LRLIFVACHPVLSAEARAALTLRLLGGLTTEEIDDWMRLDLCEDALRLGRILAELVPGEAEVHGLVALMELAACSVYGEAARSNSVRAPGPAGRARPRSAPSEPDHRST
jgi:predicted RNA polymerase sigma factor